jgi:hypothetical protein
VEPSHGGLQSPRWWLARHSYSLLRWALCAGGPGLSLPPSGWAVFYIYIFQTFALNTVGGLLYAKKDRDLVGPVQAKAVANTRSWASRMEGQAEQAVRGLTFVFHRRAGDPRLQLPFTTRRRTALS